MLLFARMARLSHRLGRRSHNSAVAHIRRLSTNILARPATLPGRGSSGRILSEHNYQFPLVSAVIGALLVGKWIAAQIVGSRLRLSCGRPHDDVVGHVVAGGGDSRPCYGNGRIEMYAES